MMPGSLAIMLLQHDQPRAKPAVFTAILLVALARRSRISWTILLLWNLFAGFAAAGALTGSGWTVGAPLLAVLGLGCAALLLTPSMRNHVGSGHSYGPGRPAATPL
jgi:hypothetical protein